MSTKLTQISPVLCLYILVAIIGALLWYFQPLVAAPHKPVYGAVDQNAEFILASMRSTVLYPPAELPDIKTAKCDFCRKVYA